MDVGKLDHRLGQRRPPAGRSRRRTPVEMDHGPVCRKAWAASVLLIVAAFTAQPAWACRLSVLGDSLAAGYGVAEEDAFPVRLDQALRGQAVVCEVINAGVSGDTSAGGLARLDWVLGDGPTHLLVELGGNDALRGLPAEELEKNLSQIITHAKARGVKVVLAGMLAPPNLGRSYGDAFRQVYSDLAREHEVPLYPFFLDGVVLDEGLMQPDGIHPNARGVRVIVERIAPLLAATIQDN
jgi:acyl-CoA thioesterase-1